MIVETKNLLAAIDRVKHLAKSGPIALLNSVLIEGFENQIKIHTWPGDEYAFECVEAEGKINSVVVNLNHLLNAIRLGEKTVIENEGAHLSIKPSGVRLAVIPASEFVKPDLSKPMKPSGACSEFIADGITSVAWASYRDSDRPNIQAVHVIISPKQVTAEATDGRWMAWFEKPARGEADVEILIPDKFSKFVAEALRREDAQLLVSDRAVMVTHKHGAYWCKQVEDKFPTLTKQIREEKGDSLGTIEVESLRRILRVGVGVFSSPEQFPYGDLLFSANGLQLNSKSQSSDFEHQIKGSFADGKIRVNMARLLQCLEAFSGANVEIAMSTTAIIMRSGDLTVMLQKMFTA